MTSIQQSVLPLRRKNKSNLDIFRKHFIRYIKLIQVITIFVLVSTNMPIDIYKVRIEINATDI